MKQRLYTYLWHRISQRERDEAVLRVLLNRTRRRAALGPFALSFEDEINAASVDITRDFNRVTF